GKQKQKLSKSVSDKVRKSKAAPEIQKNPFEVKINRKKFDVLGRKSKHDVGLPGVSRSKAINKGGVVWELCQSVVTTKTPSSFPLLQTRVFSHGFPTQPVAPAFSSWSSHALSHVTPIYDNALLS
ncbi:nucleolar protein 14, partial [Triplophysa rosa]